MLRRLSRLRLSLATKCQLLFGTAAGVIIVAALTVTWQRIEQLTQAQDYVAADTLARQALAEHARNGDVEGTFGGGFVATEQATVRRPRIVGVEEENRLTPFETEAVDYFVSRPDRHRFREDVLLPGPEGGEGRVPGVRTALAARLKNSCLPCHTVGGSSPVVTVADAEPVPPEEMGRLLGVVSVEVAGQVNPRERLLNRGFLITAALAAALAATTTLYFILTRLILSPVRVLQDVAERVRGGDLNVRADVSTGDEFETLARTVNEMVAGLQTRNEQLARANRSLDKRLGDLAEANVALDESNRLKGEFLANVSHELRTPLNSILGFADLVKTGAKEQPKVQRYASNIAASGQSLLELINDLLDLAKIEAGRMEVRRAKLSVGDLFEALTVLLGPLALRKKVKLVREVGPRVPIIETDGGKLQQILYNLLGNAIKFSPDGGRVDVVARLEIGEDGEPGDHVRITVTDQGPGIGEADQSLIFEKFKQVDASETRSHGGTGLGLSISRELATLLGGEINVSSKLGEGATFVLRLPVEPPERPAERVKSRHIGA